MSRNCFCVRKPPDSMLRGMGEYDFFLGPLESCSPHLRGRCISALGYTTIIVQAFFVRELGFPQYTVPGCCVHMSVGGLS